MSQSISSSLSRPYTPPQGEKEPELDAMDIDEAPQDTPNSNALFDLWLTTESPENIIQKLKSDGQALKLFLERIKEAPKSANIQNRWKAVASKVLPVAERPGWINALPLQNQLLPLAELVKQGRADLVVQRDAEELLGWRDRFNNSLLHLAIQTGQLNVARELTVLCPNLLLARDGQEKYALDYLDKKASINFIETLLSSYGEDSPLAVWRKVTPLCLLQESSWALQFARKHESELQALDPTLLGNETLPNHPLKACIHLNKMELGTNLFKICYKGSFPMAWLMIADVSPLSHTIAQNCPQLNAWKYEETPLWVQEHPVFDTLFVDWISQPVFAVNIAFMHASEVPFPKDLTRKAALYAIPMAEITKELWKKRDDDKFPQVWKAFREEDYRALSAAGLAFLVDRLQTCKEDAWVGSLEHNLKVIFLSKDLALAKKFYRKIHLQNKNKSLLHLVIKSFAQLKATEEEKEWAQQLLKVAYDLCPVYNEDMIRELLSWDSVLSLEILKTVSEWNPKNFNESIPFAILNLSLASVRANKEGAQEKFAGLVNTERNWQKCDQNKVTFRAYLFLTDESLHHLIPPSIAVPLAELLAGWKSINTVQRPIAELLIDRFYAEVNQKPDVLNFNNFNGLIKLLIRVNRVDEASLLTRLDPLLESYPDSAQALIPTLTQWDWSTMTLEDLHWLLAHGMPFPEKNSLSSYCTTSRPLLQWLIMQEIIIPPQGSMSMEYHEALRSCYAEVWQQLGVDPRFQWHERGYTFPLKEQTFLIQYYDNSGFVILLNNVQIFSGFASVDGLIQKIKERVYAQQMQQINPYPLQQLFETLKGRVTFKTEIPPKLALPNIRKNEKAFCFEVHLPDAPQKPIEFDWADFSIDSVIDFILEQQMSQMNLIKEFSVNQTWKMVERREDILPDSRNISVFFQFSPILSTCVFFRFQAAWLGRVQIGISSVKQLQRMIEGVQKELNTLLQIEKKVGKVWLKNVPNMISVPAILKEAPKEHVAVLKLREAYVLGVQGITEPWFGFYCRSPEAALAKVEAVTWSRDKLASLNVNMDLIGHFTWNFVKLMHDTPADIDFSSILLNRLKMLKQTAYLKKYTLRQKCSYETLETKLTNFLTQLKNRNIQGFVPYEKYATFYKDLTIQLSHTVQKIVDSENQEDLNFYVCELAFICQHCGPRFAELVQSLYLSHYGILNQEEALQGIEQLLKKSYGRAALETVEIFFKTVGNSNIHALNYLRMVIQQQGFSLPPDPQVEGIQDPYLGDYENMPPDRIVSLFKMFLLPDWIEVLLDMQKEATATNDLDLLGLIKTSMLHLAELDPSLEPKLKQLDKEKEEKIHQLRQTQSAIEQARQEWMQSAHGRVYQNVVTWINVLQARIEDSANQLLALGNERQQLMIQPSLNKKRKYAHSFFGLEGDTVELSRLKQIEIEMSNLTQQQEKLEEEKAELELTLNHTAEFKQILVFEENLQENSHQQEEINSAFSHQRTQILEMACDTKGWLSEDYSCPITREGLLALLTHFNFIRQPIPELVMEDQFFL